MSNRVQPPYNIVHLNSNNISQNQNFNVSNTSSTSSNNTYNNGTLVGLHYKIGKKIGEGSFGVIFKGTNIINGALVAIKFESRKTEAPQLRDEYKAYKHLQGSKGIPNAYYFGQEGFHHMLVIDLLGPSLEDLFYWCGRKFSVKTVVQVAIQMLDLVQEVHNHDLIYRDIKPDNFLIGRHGTQNENSVYLIDFGMAKQYRDPRTNQHIPYREKKSLSGTARYMSINTHLGREQLRRDDLEALGHVFFYFLKGQLPWQGLKAPTNKQKYEKIGEKKRATSASTLCEGFPKQFAEYLDLVKDLSFDTDPNYKKYKKMLYSVLDSINEVFNNDYDWMHLNGGKGWDSSINKKPNLHGYGHPNPPNERERRHRDQKLFGMHIQQQILQQNPTQLNTTQLLQLKLNHLSTKPFPIIKQESLKYNGNIMDSTSNKNLKSREASNQKQDNIQAPNNFRFQNNSHLKANQNNNNNLAERMNQYEQQNLDDDYNVKKSFFSKFCCQ